MRTGIASRKYLDGWTKFVASQVLLSGHLCTHIYIRRSNLDKDERNEKVGKTLVCTEFTKYDFLMPLMSKNLDISTSRWVTQPES